MKIHFISFPSLRHGLVALAASSLAILLPAQNAPATDPYAEPNLKTPGKAATTPDLKTGTTGRTTTSTALRGSDKSFIEDAAKSGEDEAAISKVAVERASSPQVREFALLMVSEHGGANNELARLAGAKGVALAAKPASIESWQKKDAKEFDRDYMKKMVEAHEAAVKRLETAAQSGGDTEIAAYARKSLSTVQSHLSRAREIQQALPK